MRLNMILKRPRSNASQQGIVSIMVVSVLVILLSLVTIGFARLMNRETREALDKQLGVQSYYAAESGVNDAISYLDDSKAKGTLGTAAITKCSGDLGKPFINQNLSDATSGGNPNAQYSCVLIDPDPPSLIYDIKAGQSKVFSFDQSRLTSLLVSWQNSGISPTNNYRHNGNTDFTSTTDWKDAKGKPATGALRISIYPVMVPEKPDPEPGSWYDDPTHWKDDRALTAKYSRTFFLYPDQTNSPNTRIDPIDYFDNNGAIVSGHCSDNRRAIDDPAITFPGPPGDSVYHCNSILNCLPDAFYGPGGSMSLGPIGPTGKDYGPHNGPLGCGSHIVGADGGEYRAVRYFVKVTSLYAHTNVKFWGGESIGVAAVTLKGAQAAVDSTGKGNDVLRRISARVPISSDASGNMVSDPIVPATALRTADTVCKRIRQAVPAAGVNAISVDGSGDTACTEGINP